MDRKNQSSYLSSQKILLAVLMLLAFLFRATNNSYEVFIPLFGTKYLHIKTSDLAAILGLAGAIRLAPSWYLSLPFKQEFKYRSVLLFVFLGFVLSAVSSISILISSDSRLSYLASLALFSIGSGLMFSSLPTLFAQMAPETSHKKIIYPTVAFSFALLVGPGVESLILAINKGNLIYSIGTLWTAIVAAIGLLICFWSRFKNFLSHHHDYILQQAEISKEDTKFKIGFYFALSVQLIYELPWILIVSFGAILAHSLDKFSPIAVGLSFVGFFSASFTIRILMMLIEPRKYVLAFLMITFGATIAGLPLIITKGGGYLISGMLILGVAHGVSYPLALSCLALATPAQLLPRMTAKLTFYVGLSAVVAPFLVSALLHWISLPTAFLVVGIISFPVFIISCLLYKPWREQVNKTAVTYVG